MRKSFSALLLAGALTAFVSCKDDISESGNNYVQEDGDGKGYVAFSIKTDLNTRADDVPIIPGGGSENDPNDREEVFNQGEAFEYAVAGNSNAHRVIFFDNGGEFFGSSPLLAFDGTTSDDSQAGHEHETTTADKYPETVYSFVSKSKESNSPADVPSSALVILNMDPSKLVTIDNNLSGKKINDVLAWLATPITADEAKNSELVGMYKYNGENYFTMTNSLYFGGADQHTGFHYPKIVTPIDNNQVWETPAQAYNNRITVYVERIVAKHTVNFANEAVNGVYYLDPTESDKYIPISFIEDYDGSNFTTKSIDWKVAVTGWGMNGVEPNTFLFKNIYPSAQLGNSYSSWTATTKWLDEGVDAGMDSFFTYWNFDALHRSYWAVDQHYENDGAHDFESAYNHIFDVRKGHVYPDQYRSPYDNGFTGAQGGSYDSGYTEDNVNGVTAQTSLNYLSYNNLQNADRNFGNNYYTLENTYSYQEGLKEYAPLRYGTHVILTAKLLFADSDPEYNEATAQNASTKYSAYGYFFGNLNSYIKYAFNQLCIQTGWDGGLAYKGARIAINDATKFFTTEKAHTRHGDGKQIISLKKDQDYKIEDFTYGVNETPENGSEQVIVYKPFKNEKELMDYIYANVEPVKYYNEGMMYYAIPIQHRMGRSNDNDRFPLKDLGKGDSFKYEIGQFGVVRNHWYDLGIKYVGNFGTPVEDPEQPIIPDPEDEYYLSFDIVILPWHRINNGDDITIK